jgi:hypothetical protein
MAKQDCPSVAGRPFRTSCDIGHVVDSDQPAALMFNPNASLEAVLSLLQGRAYVLSETLTAWTAVSDSGEAEAHRVAATFVPAAEEIYEIARELAARLKEAGHV